MDFYGTVVHENGPIAMEVAQQIYKNSNAKSAEEVFGYWWKVFKNKLEDANGGYFRTQHDVALESFEKLLRHFDSPEAAGELLERMEEHWCTTPIYDDARTFMEKVTLPVYFVTNSDNIYVSESLKNHDLHPAGVITSERAKYSKPRKEIFLYALEQTGFSSEEVIHIGDSLEGDIRCPEPAGIKSIWLNREAKTVPDGVTGVENLLDALNFIL